MAENLDLSPNPALPHENYETLGHKLAHESGLDPYALALKTREMAAETAALADAERARLTNLVRSLPVQIDCNQAERSSSVTRIKEDELHPDDSRQKVAKALDQRAQEEQAKLRHDLGLLLLTFAVAFVPYLYYGSAIGTAFNLGTKLEAADTPSKLMALATTIFDPRGILDALLAGNPLPALFPILPLAIAWLFHEFVAKKARIKLSICLLTVLAIDVGLAYGVTKNLHDVAVVAGLEPETPWTFLDAVSSWKWWLIVAIGFGTTVVFAMLNHVRGERRQAELDRIKGIREAAKAIRKAIETDRANEVDIPKVVRELTSQLNKARAQLKDTERLGRNALEAKLTALLLGWVLYASAVHATDEARLQKVKQEAETAVNSARRYPDNRMSLDDELTRWARSFDPKEPQA